MKDMYSSRLAIIFSCVGRAFMHILVSLFLTIVLALEREWDLSYDALIEIWTLGAFLIGAGAPLAGWLSDRYGEVWLMVAFFVGAGMATIFAGESQLDEIARRLGLDPVEFRLKNMREEGDQVPAGGKEVKLCPALNN